MERRGINIMRKISYILTSLLFAAFTFTSAQSAGDAEAIKKLSSFKKTGIDVVADVIEQNTKFRANIEKKTQNIYTQNSKKF